VLPLPSPRSAAHPPRQAAAVAAAAAAAAAARALALASPSVARFSALCFFLMCERIDLAMAQRGGGRRVRGEATAGVG
jgi:hypothetical protein